MKNKKILKTISAVVATVLIIGILVFTNAFVGNPISAAIARNAAKKYTDKNYGSLNLKLEKPVYNFKDGAYIVKAYSETSKDTYFNIHYRYRDIRDNYDSSVAYKFNTIMRLGDEYTNLVRDIISDEFGYSKNHSYVYYDKDVYEPPVEHIELDMAFDRKLPLKAEVNIDIVLEEALEPQDINDGDSLEKMAKLLEDAHNKFLRENCVFEKYGISYGYKTRVYSISNITPEQIEGGRLLEIFSKAMESPESQYEGVYIFTK